MSGAESASIRPTVERADSSAHDIRVARHLSLFAYSPALIVFAISIADSARFADPDLWGHIRFGLDVMKSGRIVVTDPYSYTALGHAWFNHEWLAEVVFAWTYAHGGILALKVLKLACATTTIVFITAAIAETGAPTMVQFIAQLSCAIAVAPQIQFRPQSFTYALLPILIYLIARDSYRGRAPLWIAIPMLALWANLHGGFILGLAALGTYAATTGAIDLFSGHGPRRLLQLSALTVAAAAATLATPYGTGTWRAVLHALGNPYTRSVIDDWQPLWAAYKTKWKLEPLATLNYSMAVSMLVAMVLAEVASPQREDAGMFAFAALMGLAALLANRNVPAMALAVATPLARHLPYALERRIPSLSANCTPFPRARAFPQIVIALISLFVLTRSGMFTTALGTSDPYPIAAVKFMRERKLSGNILAPFGWGEYLIWQVAPESKVFIDGRYDTVYPIGVISDFMMFNFNVQSSRNALSKYKNDFVLTDTKTPAHRMMLSATDWKLIYRDKDALLFAPLNSSAASIKGIPIEGKNPPVEFP